MVGCGAKDIGKFGVLVLAANGMLYGQDGQTTTNPNLDPDTVAVAQYVMNNAGHTNPPECKQMLQSKPLPILQTSMRLLMEMESEGVDIPTIPPCSYEKRIILDGQPHTVLFVDANANKYKGSNVARDFRVGDGDVLCLEYNEGGKSKGVCDKDLDGTANRGFGYFSGDQYRPWTSGEYQKVDAILKGKLRQIRASLPRTTNK